MLHLMQILQLFFYSLASATSLTKTEEEDQIFSKVSLKLQKNSYRLD